MSRLSRIIGSLLVLPALLLFMSAGGAEQELKSQPDEGLNRTRWELVSLDGRPVLPGTSITLEFGRTELYGNAGCNGYSGDYSIKRGGRLDVGDLMSTTIGCSEPEGILEQESEYLLLLHRADGFELENDRLTLTISSVKGNPRLEYRFLPPPEDVTLEGRWKVITYIEGELAGSPVAGSEAYLTLENNRFRAETDCTDLSGGYEVKKAGISFTADFTTRKECADEMLQHRDDIFFTVLEHSTKFEIRGNRLMVSTRSGDALDLEKQ